MGVVNVTPDSFSDEARPAGIEDRVSRALELVADGADLIDVGGESGVTNAPPVPCAPVLPSVKVQSISTLAGGVSLAFE